MAHFLSLSFNVLSYRFKQDHSERVLRTLVVSVLRLYLRQQFAVGVQVHTLLNISTLIKHHFGDNCHTPVHFYIQKLQL